MRICAPSATRTRDLLLRRSFRATPPPVTVQVRTRVVGLSVPFNDRHSGHVLARIWHGRLLMESPHLGVRRDAPFGPWSRLALELALVGYNVYSSVSLASDVAAW